MASPELKLLYFLSDPSLSDREFNILVDIMLSSEIRNIIRESEEMRYYIRDLTKRHRPKRRAVNPSPSLHDEISKILRDDLGLSAPAAVRLLSIELKDPQIQYSKRGFDKEINGMLARHSPSDLLSAAQRIRQKYSSDTKTDWPLD